MYNKKGLWTLFLGLVSWSGIASSVTPTNNIWQDSNGDLYYQQPVKQVTTIDEAPVSIRLLNQCLMYEL